MTIRIEHSSWIAIPRLLLLFLFASGCAKHYEKVEYNPSFVGPVRELVFTATSFGATSIKPELFTPPVSPEEQLAFSGHVAVPKPAIPAGSLRMTQQHGTKTVTCRSARVLVEEADDENGFRFRSEVMAPRKPGKYVVQIKVRDALLAIGEITVRDEARH